MFFSLLAFSFHFYAIRWLQRDINKSNIIFCKFDFAFEFEFDFAFELEFDFEFEFEFRVRVPICTVVLGAHHSLVKDGGIGVRDERLNTGMAPTCNWMIKIVIS